jgi:hypothetical protein
MSVVVSINGREAIPVRAIPYVTGWDVSPDMVAQSLANSSDGVRLDRLTAYQYVALQRILATHHRPGTAPGFSLVALNWIARIWLHGGYMEAGAVHGIDS